MKLNFTSVFLGLFFMALSSCSSAERKDETPTSPEPAMVQASVIANTLTPQSMVTEHESDLTHAESKPAKKEADHVTEHLGVAPDTAWGWLKNGNTRFVKGYFRKDGRSKSDVQKLVKGQHPHTIVLSCSDSRVPPEHVFDQALGEIFVVRVAGEALASSVIASIEYAVEHLGTRLIVVMGHTHCGAVKAALSTPEGSSAGSADLDALVADIKPRVKNFSSTVDVADASAANAEKVAFDLVSRSRIIAEKVHEGDVVIKSAMYWLNSGTVTWLK